MLCWSFFLLRENTIPQQIHFRASCVWTCENQPQTTTAPVLSNCIPSNHIYAYRKRARSMSCILLNYLHPSNQNTLFELHAHFLDHKQVSSLMTRSVRRFWDGFDMMYYAALMECHENVCREMGFVGNGKHNRVVWTYFGTDYLVVFFSNPELVLAVNLNSDYYKKQAEQHQVYHFEIFMILDELHTNDSATFERQKARPTFQEFIQQFADVTGEAYQAVDHVFPPPRLLLKHAGRSS